MGYMSGNLWCILGHTYPHFVWWKVGCVSDNSLFSLNPITLHAHCLGFEILPNSRQNVISLEL